MQQMIIIQQKIAYVKNTAYAAYLFLCSVILIPNIRSCSVICRYSDFASSSETPSQRSSALRLQIAFLPMACCFFVHITEEVTVPDLHRFPCSYTYWLYSLVLFLSIILIIDYGCKNSHRSFLLWLFLDFINYWSNSISESPLYSVFYRIS